MRASPVALVVKNPPANAGDIRGEGLIPGSGRPPGGQHDSSLQYSCLENPLDRGAWWATVHGSQRSYVVRMQGVCVFLSLHTHTRENSSLLGSCDGVGHGPSLTLLSLGCVSRWPR